MGLRINTNLNAMTALRRLKITDRETNTSLERLATGLRINRGSDDPSGLVISEQLRGQLSALDQAVDNSQNASNIISIADAALAEVGAILVDIQDSIVFSLNTGGSSPAQIAAEQDAVDQAIASIDRIAATTRYSDRGLLNGTAAFNLEDDRPNILDDLRIRSATFAGGNLQRTFTVNILRNPQRAEIMVSGAVVVGASVLRVSGLRGTEDIVLASGSNEAQIASAVNAVAGYTGIYASGTTARLNFFSDEFGLSEMVRIEVIDGRISGTALRIRNDSGVLASGGFTQPPLTAGTLITDRGLDGQTRFEGQIFTGVGREFNILSRAANIGFRIDPELVGTASSATFTVGNTGLNFQLNELPRPTDRLSVGIDSIATALLGFETFRDRLEESIIGISAGVTSGSYIMKGGFLNTLLTGGSNDLTANPRNAAEIVRSAIDQVASIRGFLGAIQAGSIQPNIDSLGVAIENITATLSDLRDLDFAEETARFTRNQILFQAGISVIASANATPQSVLALLQG